MTKVLFLLSAVVMAVALFFGYQNQQAFIKMRKDRQQMDKKITVEFKNLEAAANDVVSLKTSVAAVNGEAEQEKTRLEQAGIKLRNAKNEAERTTTDLQKANDEIKDVKSKIPKLPEGMTVETITEGINKLKTTIAENENKAKQAEEATAAKVKEVKKAEDEVADIQKRIDDRRKLFDRNSLTATVIAVNNDWGFVVIDAGKNKEITPDTKLLVTRGSETIGKLNIVSVEGNKTVANIVQKSLRHGLSVAPGDRVILESLYQ